MRKKIAIVIMLLAATIALAGSVTKINILPGGSEMTFDDGATLTIADGATIVNAIGAGTIGITSTGLSLVETGDGVLHRTTLTLDDDFEFVITDHTTAGAHGSVRLYAFLAGYVKIVGTSTDLALDCSNTNGLTGTDTYDIGIGSITAGIDNEALASTEQNVIAKVEGDMVGGVVANIHGINTTDLALDGTSTAEDLWFNVAIEAADATGNTTCTLGGTVTFTWINVGDY